MENKKDEIRIAARVPRFLKDALIKEAKEKDMSQSELLRHILSIRYGRN